MSNPNHPGVQRLQEFGETVFATITRKANEAGAINLGQGFPDTDGPKAILERAQEEIARGNNQYAPGPGFAELRQAVCNRFQSTYGFPYDPNTECLITIGATEALAASVLGLAEPNDEVIIFEPYFDSYAAIVAMAGAKRVVVPLAPVGNSWQIDTAALEQAITPKTRMILMNSPHNPTGAVFPKENLLAVAEIAKKHNLIVLSDEVYEYQVFDNKRHIPFASLPGMRERTITVSSAAKTFQVTGWKTGWALAPAPILQAITRAKQFLSFVGMSAVQPAIAYGLNEEIDWVDANRAELEKKRDFFTQALTKAGYNVADTQGSFYLVANIAPLTDLPAADYCQWLIENKNIAAIPITAFTDHPGPWQNYIRFAFCKTWETLQQAAKQINEH